MAQTNTQGNILAVGFHMETAKRAIKPTGSKKNQKENPKNRLGKAYNSPTIAL
jgi:hypothetical protein